VDVGKYYIVMCENGKMLKLFQGCREEGDKGE
jgi:hypothetical protein